MFLRATRWAVAALIGSAMTTIGCARPIAADEPARVRQPIVADDSLVHAFDTRLETRLMDRLELDNFLRDRDIRVEVIDGAVNVTGEVWTPLEKQRVSDLIRHVAGVIDVANHLDVRPPE
jgi:osmotically-inducible protein OsmY